MSTNGLPIGYRPAVLALYALALLTFLGAGAVAAGGRLNAPNGVALDGYDPVAYFVEGEARVGRPDVALRWRGTRWHFSTPANRAAFEANPRAFAPQFGGYCAFALSQGRVIPGNPKNWIIHDGRLYLTETQEGRAHLAARVLDLVQVARGNWSGQTAAQD